MRRALRLGIAGMLLAGGTAALAQVQPPPAPPPAGPPPAPAPAPTPQAPLQPVAPPVFEPLEPVVPPALDPVVDQAALGIEPEPPPKPKEPMKRGRADAAILQALDKVTAETLRFEAPVGQPVRYKSLVFTVRACEAAAPDELAPEAAAYLVIDSQPRPQPGRAAPPARQVFRGWMFASSPSLNPLEHPVYDAWVIACRTAGPSPEKR